MQLVRCWFMRTACPAGCKFIPSTSYKPAATLSCRCAHHAASSNHEQVQRVLQKSAGSGRLKGTSLQTRERSPAGDHAGSDQQHTNEDSKEPIEANPFDSVGPPRELTAREQLTFERRGHICTRGLFKETEVASLQSEIRLQADARCLTALQHRVRVLLPAELQLPVTDREQGLNHLQKHSKELGFLQHFNLHRHAIRPLLLRAWQIVHAKQPCHGMHASLRRQHHSTGCCHGREVPLIRHLVMSKRLAAAAAQLLGVKRVRLYQDCVFLKEPGFTETNWHSDLLLSPLDTNGFVTAWIPLRPLKVLPIKGHTLFCHV